ncbi:MAG: DUF3611 family protein [Cyanosarcina radialis HA8281-LM2]|nr:DUF3611 family protein [Cyanosarcina radialis HA8281-LM2]
MMKLSLPPPTKQRFAATFRVASRFSFWIQLALGSVSAIALLFAIFSRNLGTVANNTPMGFGIFLAIVGLLILGFRVYWAFRYRLLAKRLQSAESASDVSKQDVIQALRLGLIVSLSGVFVAFLASEISVVAVLAKALAEPQGIAVYNRENVIRSLDILAIFSNVNLIGAHLVSTVTSLGLLEWLE